MDEKQLGVLERVRSIAEVLSKAVAVAEEIVGCVPANAKESKEPSDTLAQINSSLDTVDERAHYLLDRLGEVQRRL